MTETEAKWSERVREWRASGKGAQEFAAGRSYKASTLRWWGTELRRRAGGADRQGKASAVEAARTIRMARVVTGGQPRKAVSSPLPTAPQSVVVELSGARIVVARGFDAALLSEVVRVLRGAQ